MEYAMGNARWKEEARKAECVNDACEVVVRQGEATLGQEREVNEGCDLRGDVPVDDDWGSAVRSHALK